MSEILLRGATEPPQKIYLANHLAKSTEYFICHVSNL